MAKIRTVISTFLIIGLETIILPTDGPSPGRTDNTPEGTRISKKSLVHALIADKPFYLRPASVVNSANLMTDTGAS